MKKLTAMERIDIENKIENLKSALCEWDRLDPEAFAIRSEIEKLESKLTKKESEKEEHRLSPEEMSARIKEAKAMLEANKKRKAVK